MKNIKYKECVEELEKMALSMTNCTHTVCSMSEAAWEEVFGEDILKIIRKHKCDTK